MLSARFRLGSIDIATPTLTVAANVFAPTSSVIAAEARSGYRPDVRGIGTHLRTGQPSDDLGSGGRVVKKPQPEL
jgi:hypothetical protein